MIELVSDPTPPAKPALPGSVILRQTTEEVIDAMAADLLFQARSCVRAFGDFHLALSGGTTPEPLYERLMIDPALREFPWMRTHLWVVDERRVPPNDIASNFRMIRETIVDQSGIPPEQVHPIDALSPTADVDYQARIQECLAWREPGHDRLDYVLLGMGEDGHTASLFPGSPALAEDGRLVAINSGPSVTPPDRVTMTLRLLNASRFVAFMVIGPRKKPAVARVAAGVESVSDLPAMGIRPIGGELRWYLDWAACPTAPARAS